MDVDVGLWNHPAKAGTTSQIMYSGSKIQTNNTKHKQKGITTIL
jgi:hypothetical protein